MNISLGNVKIQLIREEVGEKIVEFIRLTLETPYASLDQLEAEGETLAEALLRLHEEVEIFNKWNH